MYVLVLIDNRNIGPSGDIPHRFLALSNAIRLCGFTPKFGFIDDAASLYEIIHELQGHLFFVFSTFFETRDAGSAVINIHEFLESASIPYIGSRPEILELVISKAQLKHIWNELDILTPDFRILQSALQIEPLKVSMKDEEFPVIVKPSREGNSRGISAESVITNPADLAECSLELVGEYSEIIVEKYLGNHEDMREFTVAMIGNGAGAFFLPAELVLRQPQGNKLITTHIKESGGVLPKPVRDAEVKVRLLEFAKAALIASGVSDYGRCDIIFTGNKFYALEVNGQPMIPDPWFSACALDAGLSEAQYIAAILFAGILRINQNRRPLLSVPSGLLDILPQEMQTLLLQK